MALELAASRATAHTLRARLPIIIRPGGFELDWRPAMALCAEATDIDAASAAWHATLIEGIVAGAHAAALSDVLLTGGCFQNKRLCDGAARRLREEGFRAHVQRLVPLNDGGLSAGQATAAVLRREAICTRAL